jgi:hypothetical protein
VPYKIVDRRPGDTVAVWAATEYAEQELGWKAKLGLTEMCRDQWAWAKKYPKVGQWGQWVLRVVDTGVGRCFSHVECMLVCRGRRVREVWGFDWAILVEQTLTAGVREKKLLRMEVVACRRGFADPGL